MLGLISVERKFFIGHRIPYLTEKEKDIYLLLNIKMEMLHHCVQVLLTPSINNYWTASGYWCFHNHMCACHSKQWLNWSHIQHYAIMHVSVQM